MLRTHGLAALVLAVMLGGGGGGGAAFSIFWDRVGQLVASFGASETDRGSGMDPDGGGGTAAAPPEEPASEDETDRGSIMDPNG